MNKIGFVYLVNQPGTDIYKIGHTKNLRGRMGDILGANPFSSIEYAFIGSMADEKHLHRTFSDRRVRREWFVLHREDIEWITAFFSEKYTPSMGEYFRLFAKEVAVIVNASIKENSPIEGIIAKKSRERPPEKKRALSMSHSAILTDFEKSEFKRRGFSEKSARAAKIMWMKDVEMNAVELCRLCGFSESFCQKAVSVFKKSTDLQWTP